MSNFLSGLKTFFLRLGLVFSFTVFIALTFQVWELDRVTEKGYAQTQKLISYLNILGPLQTDSDLFNYMRKSNLSESVVAEWERVMSDAERNASGTNVEFFSRQLDEVSQDFNNLVQVFNKARPYQKSEIGRLKREFVSHLPLTSESNLLFVKDTALYLKDFKTYLLKSKIGKSKISLGEELIDRMIIQLEDVWASQVGLGHWGKQSVALKNLASHLRFKHTVPRSVTRHLFERKKLVQKYWLACFILVFIFMVFETQLAMVDKKPVEKEKDNWGERFQAALSSSQNLGLIVIDSLGKIEWVNQGVARLLNLEHWELMQSDLKWDALLQRKMKRIEAGSDLFRCSDGKIINVREIGKQSSKTGGMRLFEIREQSDYEEKVELAPEKENEKEKVVDVVLDPKPITKIDEQVEKDWADLLLQRLAPWNRSYFFKIQDGEDCQSNLNLNKVNEEHIFNLCRAVFQVQEKFVSGRPSVIFYLGKEGKEIKFGLKVENAEWNQRLLSQYLGINTPNFGQFLRTLERRGNGKINLKNIKNSGDPELNWAFIEFILPETQKSKSSSRSTQSQIQI